MFSKLSTIMKTATPTSPWRREARRIVAQVIEDHVFGPVQCLPHGDVLELRAKLRESYPFGEKEHYPYRVWCQEVRSALGFEVKMPKRKHKRKLVAVHNVMPSMRAWAKERGILAEA